MDNVSYAGIGMRRRTTIFLAAALLATSPAGASIESVQSDFGHGFPPQAAGVSSPSSGRLDDTAWKPLPLAQRRRGGARPARIVTGELRARNGVAAIARAPAVPPDPAPRPSSLSMLAVGLLGVCAMARRRLFA